MGRLRACLLVAAGLAVLWLVTEFLARWLGTHRKLTFLAVMLCTSGLLSVIIALQKRTLRSRLLQMPEQERKALARISDDVKFALPKAGVAQVRNTVIAGKILVNGPLLPLMLGPFLIMQTCFAIEPPLPQFLALGAGFTAAWLWWSVSVYHWRRWARSRGMSAAEVQYHGEGANLLWPRGHFFERTEWKHRN
ncbi:hypothetical protein [Pseudoduganella violaceinigra]|uniref:hypothetical protein n=1 Tax=Pseudoduganella violaceinigra TaxID=246602 RepID=UPI0004113A29|nr:hypothetical protein [Pseudoduganella violaceinigra]